MGDGVAVNLLLNRDVVESTSLDAFCSLSGLSSGESPARSTATLVLDRSRAFASPVLGSAELLSIVRMDLNFGVRLRFSKGSEHFLELSLS